MESRLIAAAGDTAQKVENEELKSVLVREKEESEKVGLKLNVKKKKSRHLVDHFMASRWG